MENDYDVYGDLEELCLKSVLNEKNDLLMKLEEKYCNATNEIESLEVTCKALKQKCRNIEKSFWILLDVCKAEIKRKDAQLDTLRAQRDDITFRRINTNAEFLARYPSEITDSSTESENKTCNNFFNEINNELLNSRNHSNLIKNPFKIFDKNQFLKRNKHSPIRGRDKNSFQNIYHKSSSQENSSHAISLKVNKNVELPIPDTIKHQSRASIYKSLYQSKNLSLSENSQERNVNKNDCDKMLENEIKNTDLSMSKPDKVEKAKGSEQFFIDISSNNGNGVNSDTINISLIEKQVQDSLSVLQNKCKEPIKEGKKIKSDKELLGKNKKFDVELLSSMTLENKPKNSSKSTNYSRTFEEILFDDIVSGKDALELKSLPLKTTTTLQNCSDQSWFYDNMGESSFHFNSSKNLNTDEISKELYSIIYSDSVPDIYGLSEQQPQSQSKELDNRTGNAQKLRPGLIHKTPKKLYKKFTSLVNVATIDSNIVKEPISSTETFSIDTNLLNEQVKLHLAKTQNPDVISSAVASITNEINYEKILDRNSSGSFKTVETTPESSLEPASRLFSAETLEATVFLTTNLLISKKMNSSTSDDGKKIVCELNTNNICINKDNKKNTEHYSKQPVKDCSDKSDLKISDLEKESGNNFSSEFMIKNNSTEENKKNSKRKMKDKVFDDSKKKLKSETTNKVEQKQSIGTEDIKQSELFLTTENLKASLSENVTKIYNCTAEQSKSKSDEYNLNISHEVNDELTIFATGAKTNKRLKVEAKDNLKLDAVKHLLPTNIYNNDDLISNGKVNLTSNKNTENLQSMQNSYDTLSIIQRPNVCNSNMIRKSTRILKRTEKCIANVNFKNDEKLQNEEQNNIELSVPENKLSEKDEELFNYFFKSPFHSSSVESINISEKSELSHQIERDFEEMFSTPPQISTSDTSKKNKIVETTTTRANENDNNGKCLDNLDLTNNKQETNLNNSLYVDNNLNESQLLSNSTIINITASRSIKKFSTSLKEYELFLNENGNNANESVTWVITKKKTKKKKKVNEV